MSTALLVEAIDCGETALVSKRPVAMRLAAQLLPLACDIASELNDDGSSPDEYTLPDDVSAAIEAAAQMGQLLQQRLDAIDRDRRAA